MVNKQCCGSGSGAFLTPGSGSRIGFFRMPDLGSRSQAHIFESLMTIFWVKSSKILFKLVKKIFFASSKIEYFQFCYFCGYKKMYKKMFTTPLCCYFWIRDPRWIKIRIRDLDKHPGSATLEKELFKFTKSTR
jgi:hypothetical protein